MAWQEPKTNWKAGDSPSSSDFNRIEENTKYVLEEAGKVNTVNNVSPDTNKNITLKPSNIGAVPASRTVNGKALSYNIVLDGKDIRPIEKLTLYCNSVSGSDNNDGLTDTRAFKTFAKAVEVAKSVVVDEVEIRLAVGNYAAVNLKGILAGKINVIGNYNNADNCILNGDFDFDYMDNKAIEFMHFKLNGDITSSNRSPVKVFIYSINITGSIRLQDVQHVYIKSCIINGPLGVITLDNVGVALIESNTLISQMHNCVRVTGIGYCNLEYNTLTITGEKRADIGAIALYSATTAKAYGNKGTLGITPVFEVSSSILFKGKNDATGAADIKIKGGQIYDAT